jgi:SAM-dependent methyltransferase
MPEQVGVSERREVSRGEGSEPEWARRLYRWLAPIYDALRRIWSRWTAATEAALDELFAKRISSDSQILELAPGTGINLDRVFRCAPGFHSYLGIDVSEVMLARARPRTRGDPRIVLRVGDATDLSGVLGPFEYIVCTWLLSHLDAPRDTARGALSKLAPGGSAVFVFFTKPESRLVRWLLNPFMRLFRVRFVDPEPFRTLPYFERMTIDAGGMATLVVFRRPAPPDEGRISPGAGRAIR